RQYPAIHESEVDFLVECAADSDIVITDNTELEEITGGNYYLVESEEDLKEIKSFEFNQAHKQMLTTCLHDEPLLMDGVSFNEQLNMYIFFLGTNNGGGPVWYIPKEIADKNPNVEATFKRNNEYWNNPNG
ncbi:MAG TPA: hypothetical protein P5539_05465, partial [Mesotoga sp.]|nr:hypothetical protein [Mesotoga sp.]